MVKEDAIQVCCYAKKRSCFQTVFGDPFHNFVSFISPQTLVLEHNVTMQGHFRPTHELKGQILLNDMFFNAGYTKLVAILERNSALEFSIIEK